jgi:glutamate dehydrogenase/leucine dehydrogenase
VTAETVFQATRRGLRAATGSGDFDGRRVGVVGLGKVGGALAAKLAEAGAHVIGCDLDAGRCACLASDHGIEVAPSAEAILAMELDVLAPCAAGGMIDDALAHSIDCRVVAGAANNPLTDRRVARTLMEREIVYVPDFLANCGGLIHVSMEWYGEHGASEADLIAGAMDRLDSALETAEADGVPPIDVAERQALERVEAARRQ